MIPLRFGKGMTFGMTFFVVVVALKTPEFIGNYKFFRKQESNKKEESNKKSNQQ